MISFSLVYQQSNGVLFYHVFSLYFMEILNTVVENLVDLLVKKEYHIEAKKAKDIAAGGVLLSA